MYTIKAIVGENIYMLHNPLSKLMRVGGGYYDLPDNLNGQAEFLVYRNHPYYSYVKKMVTEIVYYDEGDEVFRGRVLYDDEDMHGTKHVFVEGQLAYLNDSIQRPAVYHGITVAAYLGYLLENHNSQVEDFKKFYVGRVTVTDSNDSIYRYSNWENTRKCITEKLIDRLGGHLVVRWGEDNLRYLDYLADADFYEDCTQTIEFGKNMLDYSKTITAADIATQVIPLGYRLPEDQQDPDLQEQRLTIESVNGGVDYVTDLNAVAEFGKITKTIINDDITTASYLMTYGQNYLSTVQYEKLVLNLKAIDLGLKYDDIARFHVGSRVHCISTPHGMDTWLPLSQMRIYIQDFKQNTVTLGNESVVASYTSSNRQTTGELEQAIALIPSKKEILDQALAAATSMLNEYCTSGVAIHTPNEFIVADNEDPTLAVNLWRWGLGGLAHYSHGYDGEVDGVALTMDGTINGNMIAANSIMAASIDLGYRTEVAEAISDGDAAVTTAYENSITNAENRIKLYATSEATRMSRKEYVVNGEQSTLDLESFTTSGTAATITEAEFLNMNCFKVEFTNTGTVYIEQDLGTLPAGTYYIEFTFAYPLDDGLTTLRPNTVYYGFSNNRTSVGLSTYSGNEMHTLVKAVEITKASKTMSVGIYGTSGKILYVTNIRVLRDITELIDDVSAELVVEADAIRSTVNELYENVQHEYCENPDFSDSSDYFAGWTRSNTSAVTRVTYNNESCMKILNDSSKYNAYYRISVPKTCPFRVRFRAACASAHTETARLRVYLGNTSKYTAAGDLTNSFQTFEFDFSSVSAGTKYMYIYNYVENTTVYITDVEILGYGSAYYESQITQTQNSITSEVTARTNADTTLQSQITQNATAITTKITSSDAESLIEQKADSIRLKANSIAWNSTNSSMTSAGVLTCTGASITGGTFTQTNGNERFKIENAVLEGYHNNYKRGYIDMSADTRYGDSTETTYEMVIGSTHNVCIEMGSAGAVQFIQNNTIVAYVDGNGWHGPYSADM